MCALSAREIRERQQKQGRINAREQAEQHTSGFARTAVMLPDGVNSFMPDKEGTYTFDVIPYVVPDGGRNPYRRDGDLAYERTYYAHRGIGPNQDMYVCPAKEANKPCPICEHVQQLVKTAKKDDKETQKMIQDLRPKERQLWNIYDHDDKARGVQVFDMSFHRFGKQLNARIKTSKEEKGWDYFADIDDGFTLEASFANKSMGENSKPFLEACGFDFVKRGPLSDEVLEAAVELDKLLIVPGVTRNAKGELILTYERLKEIFLQTGEDDEDADDVDPRATPANRPPRDAAPATNGEAKTEKPAERPKPKTDPKPEPKPEPKKNPAEAAGITKGCVVVHEDYGPCKVLKISDDGTTVNLMDPDDEVRQGIAVAAVRLKKPKAETEKKAEAPAAEKPKAEKPKQTKPPEPDPPAADDDWGDEGAEVVAEAVESAGSGGPAEDDWDADWETS